MGRLTRIAPAFLVAAACLQWAHGADALEDGFREPPLHSRQRVWWHWMNGNVSAEGVDLDLAWLKRVGIGGVQNFDAALDTPTVMPHRLAYMTPEWNTAFSHAVQSAEELGLEFAIASHGTRRTGLISRLPHEPVSTSSL